MVIAAELLLHFEVIKRRLVSSPTNLSPQPMSFIHSEIPDPETSGSDTESEAEGIHKAGT